MGCNVGLKIVTWSSDRYTTKMMSQDIYASLCNKRGRTVTYFENEVKRLILNGPPTKEQLGYIKCDCLNKSEVKGVCVLGACVEISPGGWSVSINVS
tara:strand:- start:652 stop:942 length:291 start_codon:yes stop_codon:yes gene_type:complete